MTEACRSAIEISQEYCSKCSICYSTCPYKAIKRDSETGKFEIDLEKCQVCGICYSACPSRAIEIVYYDYEDLLKRIDNVRSKVRSDTLILMCRGNSPATCEINEILENQGLRVASYIPLRLPCSGRVPTEFIFQALESGIRNIVSIQCEDEFCRFKEGSKINTRRLMLSNALLEQLGFSKDALRIIKYSHKAVYETEKCVGCDKCVFICPYDAIEAEEFATPKIDNDLCMGCGACALVCPHLAIQIKSFEFETISKLIKRYGEAAVKIKAEKNVPAILVLCCQWSEFSALDDPESLLKRNAVGMEIPCFKALDPVHIVESFHSGFDGVIALVCSEEDCKLREGGETAERNMAVLKKTLEKMNLLERFELLAISPRCVRDFNQRLDEFLKKISPKPLLKRVMQEADICTK